MLRHAEVSRRKLCPVGCPRLSGGPGSFDGLLNQSIPGYAAPTGTRSCRPRAAGVSLTYTESLTVLVNIGSKRGAPAIMWAPLFYFYLMLAEQVADVAAVDAYEYGCDPLLGLNVVEAPPTLSVTVKPILSGSFTYAFTV